MPFFSMVVVAKWLYSCHALCAVNCNRRGSKLPWTSKCAFPFTVWVMFSPLYTTCIYRCAYINSSGQQNGTKFSNRLEWLVYFKQNIIKCFTHTNIYLHYNFVDADVYVYVCVCIWLVSTMTFTIYVLNIYAWLCWCWWRCNHTTIMCPSRLFAAVTLSVWVMPISVCCHNLPISNEEK